MLVLTCNECGDELVDEQLDDDLWVHGCPDCKMDTTHNPEFGVVECTDCGLPIDDQEATECPDCGTD